MNLTVEQINKLTDKYPYLIPRNSWTGEVIEDYDYTYTEMWALPDGWHRLFLLFCKNLKPHLEKANFLDKFYFTQLKEKYGTMRIYTSGVPDSVNDLISYYEAFSEQICIVCGKPSNWETIGWVSFVCDEHCKYKQESHKLHSKSCMTLFRYSKDESYQYQKSFRPLRNEYNYVCTLTEEEFIDYLLN